MKLQDAYAGNQWIELRPSRIARKLKFVFYALVLASIATWSLPLIWKSFACLLVSACYLLDYFGYYFKGLGQQKKDGSVDVVALSSDKGIIATRKGARIHKVQSFKIEHILCYYIQIYLCYENGSYKRLYIFSDSMDEKAFHKFRCMGVRYKVVK